MKKGLLFCGVLALLFACKKTPTTVTKITATTIAIDSTQASKKEITATVAPYKEKMIAEINKVISYTEKDLVRTDGNLQSSLGNLMADLCYDIANPIFREKTGKNIDFAMFNYGGIRAGIPKGKITNKHAFQLMPFENKLVVTEITGEKVEELVNYFIKNQRAHPLSKQVGLTISKDNYQLTINGQPFQKDKTYFVLTHDYLQGGGDNMVFFKAPQSLTPLDYKVRDAIITYFKSVEKLTVQLDNRVIVE